MIRHKTLLLSISIASFAATAFADTNQFAQFRGPAGNGVVEEQTIPLNWSADKNVAWKIPMEGAGWSQPVVWENKLYLTSAVSSQLERPKKFSESVMLPQSMGLGGLINAPDIEVQWQVQCIDTQSGAVTWTQTVVSGKPPYPTHPSNTYATESPVVNASGVFVWFGSIGKLAAYDHSGALKWQRDIEPQPMSNGFGTGSSLAMFNDLIFVQSFSEESADVYGVNNATGDIQWTHKRASKGSAWSTPVLWKNEQRAELIVSAGDQVESLNPLTGEVLWKAGNVKAATACSVCSDTQRLYFGGSDPFAKGSLFAVKPGAAGDISPQRKDSQFGYCDWVESKAAPGMSSPASDGKFVYIIDKNILRCYDAATGKRQYQERVPELSNVAASILVVGDKLLLVDEGGTSVIVAAGAQFQIIATNKLDDTVWATPAISQGSIYIRGVENLYCIRE